MLGLLVLPALIGPKSSGSVLGVIENKQTSSTPAAQTTQIGEIGSGAFETKATNTDNTGKIYTGKAIWDVNATSQVSTDKFNLGQSIKVTNGTISQNLVVGDVRVLASDTLLVLNKDTFQKLGGDPQKDTSIDVTVVTN